MTIRSFFRRSTLALALTCGTAVAQQAERGCIELKTEGVVEETFVVQGHGIRR